jgi:multiple sugar transport system substrate-binding protein
MKRTLALLILLLAFGIQSWAAGGAEAPSGPVTLRIMSPASDFTDEWISAWNSANPDIQLIREEVSQAKWIADHLAGTPADIINVGAGADIPYFAKRGLLLDLTKYFSGSSKIGPDIDKEGSGAYFFEKKWYGLPKDYNNVTAITYNKELFTKAGIPFPSQTVPMTYAEFYALAKKLSQPGKGIFGTEVHGGWSTFIASDMAFMLGKTLHVDNQSKMNEDPVVRDIWKYFLRLRKDNISSNLTNTLSGWAGSAFQSDNIAMVQLGYWYGASCAAIPGYVDKYGWAPAPVMVKGGTRVTNSLGATGFVISAKTKYPDQAFKVFEWYMADTPGVERAVTGWGIPPLKSLQTKLPYGNAFDKARKDIALEEVKYMRPPQISWYTTNEVYLNNWKEAERAYLSGSVTEDGAIDMFYKSMNEALKLGKEEVGE